MCKTRPSKVRHIVIMGVSGCGKTTVGRAVARALGRPFIEGDDFHPPANVAKMAAGQALSNTDREAWIAALCRAANAGDAAVISCSALNETVRNWLSRGCARDVRFVHLSGRQDLIAERLSARKSHFFDPALLASQFEALSPPRGAITVSVDQSVDAITAEVLRALDDQ